MIYNANATRWQPGALVIHDADAKRAEMLMVVTSYSRKTGLCITRYNNPDAFGGDFPGNATYKNDIAALHDPARFGIAISEER